ncbi:MAG: hypothetical protein K0R94_1435, partial [Burkholderiales bacterium]|nr:hypothetical protein [Burkholderiales bacterium]
VRQSLRLSTRRNLPDKRFCYLRTVRVTAAASEWVYSVRKHLLLAYSRWADVKPHKSFYNFSKFCVFNKQSLPLDFVPHYKLQIIHNVKLVPKLHFPFAEFLQLRYSINLSILYLSTSVGLQYG